MAPRENYFFYILTEVKWLFDSYALSDKMESYDEMWFEFNNTPLKWYLIPFMIIIFVGMCLSVYNLIL